MTGCIYSMAVESDSYSIFTRRQFSQCNFADAIKIMAFAFDL